MPMKIMLLGEKLQLNELDINIKIFSQKFEMDKIDIRSKKKH